VERNADRREVAVASWRWNTRLIDVVLRPFYQAVSSASVMYVLVDWNSCLTRAATMASI
jgi:hypothetical protein